MRNSKEITCKWYSSYICQRLLYFQSNRQVFFVLFFSILLSLTLSAQRNGQDSLVKVYLAAQKDNLSLYNGRQFTPYSSLIKGNPYYNPSGPITGSVLYDGMWYHNIPLLYDIHKDELIVTHPGGLQIRLISERVSEFVIAGEKFVYLNPDVKNPLTKGFYVYLSEGRVSLYKKSSVRLEERTDGLQVERDFILSTQFFILKGAAYSRIKKQDDLMSLLSDKSRDLAQYKNKEGLRFKKDPGTFITNITRYYNQLR
ncbi:MAG TPA: hypothetical protein VF476_19705 [Chitinophagaceae bacterium]